MILRVSGFQHQLFFHVSFVLLVLAALMTQGVATALWVVAASILHERARALTAERIFDAIVRDTVLYPATATVVHPRPLPTSAVVGSSLAGPVLHLALAGLLHLGHIPSGAKVNLALGLANLLPILPLDGGRALWSLLIPILGYRRATERMLGWSRCWALPLLLAAPWTGVYSLFLAWLATRADLMVTSEVGCPNTQHWFLARPPAGDYWLAVLDFDHCGDWFRREHRFAGLIRAAGYDYFRKTVQAWQSQLEPGCWLGRYGGDEFGLFMPAATLEPPLGGGGTREMAWEQVERLRRTTPAPWTVSIGLAHGQGDLGQTLAQAEAAMEQAKAQGRNRTVIYAADSK